MNFLKGIGRKFSKKVATMTVMAMAMMVAVASSAFASPPDNSIDFSTTTGLDINVVDVVKTGFSFMNMFNTYTMLVLGIIFAPVAIGFIIWIWGKLPRLGKKSA